MLVGIHVPDFLVFGIKGLGFSSVAIEIDGDSHAEKCVKDFQKYENLSECDIMTISVPNSKVRDFKYIKGILSEMIRKRSGALDRQIKANKRRIWCKTISCQITLKEIEIFAKNKSGIDLYLVKEAKYLLRESDCPRSIRRELHSVSFP
jgi:hypothetical protein